MKSNHHTTEDARQSCTSAAATRIVSSGLVLARSAKPRCIPPNTIRMRPVLVGDRQILRNLRAAEMAAWESERPQTTVERQRSAPKSEKLWQLRPDRSHLGESLLFLLLATCAGAASFAGLGDISELVNRWSLFVQGIRNLLE